MFSFPKEEPLLSQWCTFVNRGGGFVPNKHSFLCARHFSPSAIIPASGGRKRAGLHPGSVPTLFGDPRVDDAPSHIKNLTVPQRAEPRRPPTVRGAVDEDPLWEAADSLPGSLPEIRDKLQENSLGILPDDCVTALRNDSPAPTLSVHRQAYTASGCPEARESLVLSPGMAVRLFWRSSPVPLPKWFRENGVCKLQYVSEIPALLSHASLSGADPAIIDELIGIRFIKNPTYPPAVLRYSLLLRYTSPQAYRQLATDFNLPSPRHLRRLTEGTVDTLGLVSRLLGSGALSRDIILMLDEMCESVSARPPLDGLNICRGARTGRRGV
jgi:hypothetical protein